MDEGVLLDGLGVLELAEEAFAVADLTSPSASTTRPSSRWTSRGRCFSSATRPASPTPSEDSSGAVKASRGRGADLSRLRALHGGFQPELGLLHPARAPRASPRRSTTAMSPPRARRSRRQGAPRPPPRLRRRPGEPSSRWGSRRRRRRGAAFLRRGRGGRGRVHRRPKAPATPRRSAPRSSARLSPGTAEVRSSRPPARSSTRERWALCGMGYPRALAAAALRATENAVQMALDALAMARDALEEDAAATEAENAQRKAARGARADGPSGGRGRGGGGGGGGGDADAPLTGDAAIASDPAGDAGERDGSSSGDDDSGSGGVLPTGSSSGLEGGGGEGPHRQPDWGRPARVRRRPRRGERGHRRIPREGRGCR